MALVGLSGLGGLLKGVDNVSTPEMRQTAENAVRVEDFGSANMDDDPFLMQELAQAKAKFSELSGLLKGAVGDNAVEGLLRGYDGIDDFGAARSSTGGKPGGRLTR
jgi:hypothetical protein